jgi:hypothetical protein
MCNGCYKCRHLFCVLTSGPMTTSAQRGTGCRLRSIGQVNQIKSNQIKKFYLKSVHFITIQHKLSRAFQTDMHNKLTFNLSITAPCPCPWAWLMARHIKFNHIGDIRVGKTICCKLGVSTELLKVFFFETFWPIVYFINT